MPSACLTGRIFSWFQLAFPVSAGKNLRFIDTMPMQTNTSDAPAEIIFKLWPWLEANKQRLIIAAVVAVIIAGILFFISSQQEQKAIDAGLAVTSLMLNPAQTGNPAQLADSLGKLATQYAGTPAGLRAQLQAAGTLFMAGNYAEAQSQFEKFLGANMSGPLAATAELGLGASLEAQNKADAAAAAYQRVISQFPGSACVADAEFALGRIAESQNKLADAESHFEKVAIAAGMGGTLVQEARMRAAELQVKIAAAAPKTVAKPAVSKPALEQAAPAAPLVPAAKP